ncbi:MAG TPA: hypothetical protein VLV50_17575 [Stellaceae bacterium]|nr:hypothetical protein [Stellaceae bacterium]
MSRARPVLAALAAAMVALPLHVSSAAELIVVEARGIALNSGDVIDDQATLDLKEGQHLTLINAQGATLKIDGPYDRAPTGGGGADDGGFGTALRALVTQSATRAEAGVVRDGLTPLTLPEPWILDVSRTGVVCLRSGETPMLWRENAGRPAKLTIFAGDRTWRAEATWTAGADRMALPQTVPFHGGITYRVRLDNNNANITVKLVPNRLVTPEMQAAWLADVGCDPQAQALYKTLPP